MEQCTRRRGLLCMESPEQLFRRIVECPAICGKQDVPPGQCRRAELFQRRRQEPQVGHQAALRQRDHLCRKLLDFWGFWFLGGRFWHRRSLLSCLKKFWKTAKPADRCPHVDSHPLVCTYSVTCFGQNRQTFRNV